MKNKIFAKVVDCIFIPLLFIVAFLTILEIFDVVKVISVYLNVGFFAFLLFGLIMLYSCFLLLIDVVNIMKKRR